MTSTYVGEEEGAPKALHHNFLELIPDFYEDYNLKLSSRFHK